LSYSQSELAEPGYAPELKRYRSVELATVDPCACRCYTDPHRQATETRFGEGSKVFQNPQVLLAVIGAVSAIIGALVGSLPALYTTLLTKRADERRHIRELALRMALEEYKVSNETAVLMTERNPGLTYNIPPLADYVLMMSRIAPLMDKRLTPQEVEKEIMELQEATAAARKHWQDHYGRSQGEQTSDRKNR
jgi:hypothetical protein